MIYKFLIFSDIHFPLQDDSALEWLLAQIEDFNPDVLIHAGDGLEADAASRWDSEEDWDLLREYTLHNEFLKTVREVSPNSRKVFIEGNHENNIISRHRIPAKLRPLCDYRIHHSEFQYWEQPTEYVYGPKGVFNLGQLSVYHGWETNVSSDEFQAYFLGKPYGLSVCGHTHRPIQVTQARRTKAIPLPYWYANSGCLTHLDRDYNTRKRHIEWGQACVIGEVDCPRRPRPDWFYRRNWDAETLIYKTYEEWVN